jgi:[ribosomal protein S5]-alanine N-acetyltransferase
MAFLRVGDTTEDISGLSAEGITLRAPRIEDYPAWAELRTLSRAHLTPWEPLWPRDDLSKAGFRRRLRIYNREAREDSGYGFLIFSTDEQVLLGGITLSNVRRGVSQSAMLGYWLGVPYVGQGYMSRSVRTILPFVFDYLRLHRLEAATQANNHASRGVLERNGFQSEGVLRRYLKINGVWQDHLLYALLIDDLRGRDQRIG